MELNFFDKAVVTSAETYHQNFKKMPKVMQMFRENSFDMSRSDDPRLSAEAHLEHVALHRIGHQYGLSELSPHDPAVVFEKFQKTQLAQLTGEKPEDEFEIAEAMLEVERNKKALGYEYKLPDRPGRHVRGGFDSLPYTTPAQKDERDVALFDKPVEEKLAEVQKAVLEKVLYAQEPFTVSSSQSAIEIENTALKNVIKQADMQPSIDSIKANAAELGRLAVTGVISERMESLKKPVSFIRNIFSGPKTV